MHNVQYMYYYIHSQHPKETAHLSPRLYHHTGATEQEEHHDQHDHHHRS